MVFTCRDDAIAALSGPDPDARKAAADYLADEGSDAALGALIGALSDPVPDAQINAAEALGRSRRADAVEPLAAVLLNADAPGPTRQTAARSLGALGYPEGTAALLATLQSVLDDPEGTDHNVVRAAARSLGVLAQRIGDEAVRSQAVKGLSALLETHSAVLRQVAATALAAYADPRSVEPLTGALKDESWLVRQAAVLALADSGGEETLPLVTSMMDDPNRQVRVAAADALEKLSR